MTGKFSVSAACRDVAGVVDRVTEAEDLPVARRGLPVERAGCGVKNFCEIKHVGNVRIFFARRGGKFVEERIGLRRGERHQPAQQCFLLAVLDRFPNFSNDRLLLIGDDKKIAVKIVPRLG